MRNGMAWLVCVLVFAVGGLATWSLTRGQSPASDPSPSPPPAAAPDSTPATPGPAAVLPPGEPAALVPAAPGKPAADAPAAGFALRDQIENSMGRGAEWLFRMNTVSGRFLPGFLPSVNAAMEGDNSLRQAGAAFALARASRHSGDPRLRKAYAARATQAVLALLDDTEAEDDHGAKLRHVRFPCSVNPLATAGLLVAAINELPQPQDDVLAKSEELCGFLRKQQRPDGSLRWTEEDDKAAAADPDSVNLYPGLALYGLTRSQAHRPAAWKTELARKALGYYAPWWRDHRGMAFVPWQTAAYAEAFLLTKEKPFADFVCEMNDWLCGLRHEALDPRHPAWLGGFMTWSDGKALPTAPDVSSASYAESLAEACRVARATADLPRHARYVAALESCLQFLTTLQYTDATTQHFAPLYRERLLVGGFHGSHLDGDLRIEHTQHAVCAMAQYLAYVARHWPSPTDPLYTSIFPARPATEPAPTRLIDP
jgi:hypothetical protein